MKVAHFPAFLFPPISWWQKALEYDQVNILVNENWVKQSFRNRFEIYGPNNRQRLSYPIIGSTRNGQISEVKLDLTHNWLVQNWRSLVTAYNKSPFFEFYSDELEAIMLTESDSLIEFSKAALGFCTTHLQLPTVFEFIEADYNNCENNHCSYDFRKQEVKVTYPQVFADRNGFLENLSVLDLLFNLGPEASALLQG